MIQAPDQTHDRRVPAYFAAFFLCLALVDGSMVMLAFRTHTGTVTDHPYEKGLAYNDVVRAAAIQDAWGWKGRIDFRPTAERKAALSFTLQDKEGRTLAVEALSARFRRPTQAGMDFSVTLAADGQTVSFPAPGVWDMRIHARAGGMDYQQSERIVLP